MKNIYICYMYKERLSIFSFLLLGILFLGITFISSGNANAATFNVPGDFDTIQEAIDDPGTVNGDVINVLAGTHVEDLIHITKELTIQGQGIGVTIIDPTGLTGLSGFNIVFYPDANNITIRDMTIQNSDQAIRFELAGQTIDNTDIIRVEMLNSDLRGIEIHNGTTVTNLFIRECVFDNNKHGLRLSSSGHLDGVQFVASTFINNEIGIYITSGISSLANMDVGGCTFSNHSLHAIYMEEAQNVLINFNNFMNNRRDIQILKWFQPSILVSNINIRNNTMVGTTDTVFALFNGGGTAFNTIRVQNNNAMTADGSAVFAGAHRGGDDPADAGTGWNTVRIRQNCFAGITTAGNGVRFFIPGAILPTQALGGATIDVQRNWWGTSDPATINALMEVPAITNFTLILSMNPCGSRGIGGINRPIE